MQCSCGAGTKPGEAKQTLGRGDNALRIMLSFSSCTACGRIGCETLSINDVVELTGPQAVKRFQALGNEPVEDQACAAPSEETPAAPANAQTESLVGESRLGTSINIQSNKLLLIYKQKVDCDPAATVQCVDRLFSDGRHFVVEELGIEETSSNGDCLGAFFEGTRKILELFALKWNLPVETLELAVTSAPPSIIEIATPETELSSIPLNQNSTPITAHVSPSHIASDAMQLTLF